MSLLLPSLLAANDEYQRDKFRPVLRTPRPSGQLVLLSCMDARLDLFRALGLEVGQAHVLRNAGGRATPDAIRSLVVSTHLLDTREIGVLHHSDCGLEGVTQDAIAERTGVDDVDFLAFEHVDQSVIEDVAAIRGYGKLPDGTMVWGAVYEVDSGAVRVVSEPAPA